MTPGIFEKLEKYFGPSQWEFWVLLPGEESLYVVKAELKNLKHLRKKNVNGATIFLRPTEEYEPYFLLMSDLMEGHLEVAHKREGKYRLGRLILETRSSKFQAWVKSDRSLTAEEKRFWLRRYGSDTYTTPLSRYGHAPGFTDRQQRHQQADGSFPFVKLLWIDWKDVAKIPKLETET